MAAVPHGREAHGDPPSKRPAGAAPVEHVGLFVAAITVTLATSQPSPVGSGWGLLRSSLPPLKPGRARRARAATASSSSMNTIAGALSFGLTEEVGHA